MELANSCGRAVELPRATVRTEVPELIRGCVATVRKWVLASLLVPFVQ